MVAGVRRGLAGTGLAMALGANLWTLGLLVPLGYSDGAGAIWLLAAVAPVLLVWGAARRSEGALLVGVPLASLLPAALPVFASERQGGLGFFVLAVSLIAYEGAALRAIVHAERPAIRGARIATEPAGEALWPRRLRVYRGFAIFGAVLPMVLLGATALRPESVTATVERWPGHAEAARALLVTAAGMIAALVFALGLQPALAGHLDRDRLVRARLAAARATPWSGRPRPAFYASVVIALGLMVAVVVLRARR